MENVLDFQSVLGLSGAECCAFCQPDRDLFIDRDSGDPILPGFERDLDEIR